MNKLSIDGFSFHGLLEEGKTDIFHQLESLKYRYNVDAVGIWNGFLESTEPDYIKKVKEALDEKDMVVPNIAVDGASVWDDDPEQREEFHQNALDHLEAARILDADSVRIDWGVTEPTLTDEQIDFIVKRYREYCDIAAEADMKVGPENHFGAALNPHLMKEVIETVDHPAYQILLHLGHWDVDEEKGAEMMLPHVAHTHVPQKIVEGNLQERLKVLIDNGYDGYWGIEHHTASNELVQVEWQLACVKKAFTLINEE